MTVYDFLIQFIYFIEEYEFSNIILLDSKYFNVRRGYSFDTLTKEISTTFWVSNLSETKKICFRLYKDLNDKQEFSDHIELYYDFGNNTITFSREELESKSLFELVLIYGSIMKEPLFYYDHSE